jgi:hypothetical protein
VPSKELKGEAEMPKGSKAALTDSRSPGSVPWMSICALKIVESSKSSMSVSVSAIATAGPPDMTLAL